VELTMPGQKTLRMVRLRGAVDRIAEGGSTTLTLPADGIGWFFLYAPCQEISVLDYRPNTTLFNVPQNIPKKAKFPVVDVHVHLRGTSPEERLKVMDEVGVAIAIDSPMGVRTESSYDKFERAYPDRFLTFACLNFTTRFDSEFPEDVIAKMRSDQETMGVVGISEVLDKGSGLYGHALMPEPRGKVFVDDERVLPLWQAAGQTNLPLLLHVAEPIWFYQPFDQTNEFLHWMSGWFWWNLWETDVLSHEEMMLKRERLLESVPEMLIIGAHMGSLEHDLERLGQLLDKYPNFYVEMGWRYEITGSQPHTARKFHIEYQDRILFGQDGALNVPQYRHFFRVFESEDDLFSMGPQYPKVHGLNLPDEVLRKIYYGNAAKLMPRVKENLLKLHPDLVFP
jgi:predicted TIM-barrel fold metal-dependent hydrolase